jgi:hypothetical protein
VTLDEIQAIAKALAPAIREAIDNQVGVLRSEMQQQASELRQEFTNAIGAIQIPEIPAIPPVEVPQLDIKAVAAAVQGELTLPRDGKDGQDGAAGKDADMAALETQLRTLFEGAFMDFGSRVDKALAALPQPQDGKDGAPGADGKDADPAAMRSMITELLAEEMRGAQARLDAAVTEAVAALPPAKDGTPGKDADMGALQTQLRTMFDEAAGVLTQKVEQAIAAIPAPAAGKDGVDGAPGKDCDMEAVMAEVRGLFDQAHTEFQNKLKQLDEAIANIPVPKEGPAGRDGKDGKDGQDGAPGRDGKDGQDGAPGLPGKDGENGAPGTDGRDGKDADPAQIRSAAEEVIEPLFFSAHTKFQERLEQAIAAIPVPKDGAPGRDGLSADMEQLVAVARETATTLFKEARSEMDEVMQQAIAALPVPKDGAPGRDGVDGQHGKDGVAPSADEVAENFERRFSDLLLSFERRFQECVDKAIDRIPVPKDGRDGKDGKDAFPLSAFDVVLDEDGRTLFMTFEAGDLKEHRHLTLPITLDRGVYRESGPEDGKGLYVKGDGVTAGGSFWIAQVDDPKGAPGISSEWRLAVKRGRDGKDLRPNASTRDPSKGVPMQ